MISSPMGLAPACVVTNQSAGRAWYRASVDAAPFGYRPGAGDAPMPIEGLDLRHGAGQRAPLRWSGLERVVQQARQRVRELVEESRLVAPREVARRRVVRDRRPDDFVEPHEADERPRVSGVALQRRAFERVQDLAVAFRLEDEAAVPLPVGDAWAGGSSAKIIRRVAVRCAQGDASRRCRDLRARIESRRRRGWDVDSPWTSRGNTPRLT